MEKRKTRPITAISVLFILHVLMLGIGLSAMNSTMSDQLTDGEEQSIPHEIMLPTVTLTNEVKAEILRNNMRIDTSIINRKEIIESIGPWKPYIERYSVKYNVDPNLVTAIMYAESQGNPSIVSANGAIGLMQLIPSTADFLGVQNIFDPEENIKAGVKYLSWLVRNYDETRVLWAWNAGLGMLEKHHMPRETKAFIVKVLSIKALLELESDSTT